MSCSTLELSSWRKIIQSLAEMKEATNDGEREERKIKEKKVVEAE